MAAKIIDITQYSPKSSDIFFFDNNIWMYLFCPLGNYNKQKQKYYSSFLRSINSSRSTVFINSMVLSEFANRYLRLDFDLWKKETQKLQPDFKSEYGKTSRYKETVNEIKLYINQIMKICEKTPDDFNSINLENVLQHFSHIDFNDSYYIELAKGHHWKLVTDDGDFITYQNHSLEIVTIAN
jgi:predicted nucleic acid-binding protein